jgi:RNA polymerase sigma-70 factor (ECF subfamily)
VARGPDPFERELTALRSHLLAFARTLCRDADQAEDLVQETFVKAWVARDSFQTGTNMKAWTFMILRNQFYSDKRRSWRSVTMPVTEDGTSMAELVLLSPPDQSDKLEVADLMEALSYLNPEMADAVLGAAEGLSYEELAEEAGIAVGTVKSRVSRGRAQLDAWFGLNIIEEKDAA